MLRAVISVGQRGKLPLTLLSVRGVVDSIVAHNHIRLSHSYSRPLVRYFASGDNKIKGSVGSSPAGIIGNVGQSTSLGSVTGNESTAYAQTQPEAVAGDPARDGNFAKKTGEVASQVPITPSVTECGKIGTEESSVGAKSSSSSSKASESSKAVGQSGDGPTGNKMADDAVKQLQELAANLPSKEQVEKFVFRVVAFLYDLIYLTATWTIRFVDEKIVQNNTVRYYWKRFHEKMEQAKKD
ncbi:uncharacterized protein LOC115770879 isoform X1 [Drosophila novamexicana]|uniref:uncharacterized protein LOC115770879 isoform X1 n=1 Tax=Drosophila novamexicana TaxID=47314 RepID=UPI0011E5E5E1|nr:uncharacterized protein LOC115770879 isoform X1 [Drosophila novamexicana]